MKARLTSAHYHGGEYGELAFAIDALGDDPLHTLHSLAQRWLAGTIVLARDTDAPRSMPEQPCNGGERSATTNKLGGERVAEGVSVQSGLTETQAPAAEDLRDAVRREIQRFKVDWLGAPINSAGESQAIEDSVDNICRLFAERDSSRSRLAADVEKLRAQIDILTAQTRQLTAAQASAQEKFEQIRVALRGAEEWRAINDYPEYVYGMSPLWRATNAFDQIQRLLPPENIGAMGLGTRSTDARKRIDANPPVASSDSEQATEEA